MTDRKLRILIDSSQAKKGGEEIRKQMGKVVASGKTAITTYNQLGKALQNNVSQFSRLSQMRNSYDPFSKLTKSIQAYTKRLEQVKITNTTVVKNVEQGAAKSKAALETTAKAAKDTGAAFNTSLKASGQFSKFISNVEALNKAMNKLNNTMVSEKARTEALSTEYGKNSVKVQEQRRLTEELMRSKQRLELANTDEYAALMRTRKALEDKNKELRQLSTQTKKTSKSIGGMTSQFSALGTVLAGLSVYFSGAGLARTADQYTNITNKLSAVTRGTVDVNDATRDLLATSIESRTTLEGTMDVYSKMTRINETLGKSQKEVANLTEAVTKSVAMSGATTQGAQGAIMQFAQAMSADWGTSAQELNSILEQTPALAYYMVQGLNDVDDTLNLTTGTLKKFAEQGGLSAELVFEAFQRVLPRIQEDFENTNQTISSVMANVSDAFTVTLGEIDKTLGGSDSIVSFFKELAEELPDLKDDLIAITAGFSALVGVAALGGLAAILVSIASPLTAAIAGIGLLTGVLTKAYLEGTKEKRALEALREEVDALDDSFDKFSQTIDTMGSIKLTETITDLRNEIKDAGTELETLKSSLKIENIVQRSSEVSASGLSQFSGLSELANDVSEAGIKNETVKQLEEMIELQTKRLREAESQLQTTLSKETLDASTELNTLSDSFSSLDTKALKTYKSRISSINESTSKAIGLASQIEDQSLRQLRINNLNTDAENARTAALEAYTKDMTTISGMLDEELAKNDENLASQLKIKKALEEIKQVYTEEKALLTLRVNNGSLTVEQYREQLALLNKQKGTLEGLVKEDNAVADWAADIGESLESALAGAISSAFSNGKWDGDSFINSITSAGGQAIGTSLGGPIGGAIGGAIGSAIGSALTSSYEAVDDWTHVAYNMNTGASGYDAIKYEKAGGLFSSGGSYIEETALSSDTITRLNNTISTSLLEATNALDTLGLGMSDSIDNFSTSLDVTTGDYSGASEQITDDFVEATVAYIEDFQSVNQSAIDALKQLSEDWKDLESTFTTINSVDLDETFGNLIQSMADDLVAGYQGSIDSLNSARSESYARLAHINYQLDTHDYDASRDTTDTDHSGSLGTNWGIEQRASLKSARGDEYDKISSYNSQISELNSRITSSYSEAYSTFTNTLKQAVATINDVDVDSAFDLIVSQAERYSETFYTEFEQINNSLDAAREDLEQFSDLGVDENTTIAQFREMFEDFQDSDAFNATGYAEFLAAADSLADYYDIVEDLTDNTFSNIIDWLEDLYGVTLSGSTSLATEQAQYYQQLALAKTGDQDAIDSLTDYADDVLDAAKAESSSYSQYTLIAAQLASTMTDLVTSSGGKIPEFATGGVHDGGWRVVGDGGNGSGTELEYTGRSQIFNGNQVETLIDVQGLQAELAEIRMILRSGMGTLAKNTNKSYKIFDRWDKVGLPTERDF